MDMKQKPSIQPKLFIGAVATGKSTALLQEAIDASHEGYSVFAFMEDDYLYDDLKEHPNLKIWDLSILDVLEHLSLPLTGNYVITPTASSLDLTFQIERLYQHYLIILENLGEHTLDTQSKAILSGACKVVFSKPSQTFYDLYQFLVNYEMRSLYLRETLMNYDDLLTDYEESVLLALNKTTRSYSRSSNHSMLPIEKVETGETDFTVLGKLFKQFNAVLRDFRVKKLLSNAFNPHYNLSERLQPGALTIFHFPRGKYTEEIKEQIILLLTLELQLLKESYPKAPATYLLYDEIHQIPSVLKLIDTSIHSFALSQLHPIFAVFDYYDFSRSFKNLLLHQPELVFLSYPSRHLLDVLHLSHLSEHIWNLDWSARHRSLTLNAGSSVDDVQLKRMPYFNSNH